MCGGGGGGGGGTCGGPPTPIWDMKCAAFALPCSSARRTDSGWDPPSGITLFSADIASCASSRLLYLHRRTGRTMNGGVWWTRWWDIVVLIWIRFDSIWFEFDWIDWMDESEKRRENAYKYDWSYELSIICMYVCGEMRFRWIDYNLIYNYIEHWSCRVQSDIKWSTTSLSTGHATIILTVQMPRPLADRWACRAIYSFAQWNRICQRLYPADRRLSCAADWSHTDWYPWSIHRQDAHMKPE